MECEYVSGYHLQLDHSNEPFISCQISQIFTFNPFVCLRIILSLLHNYLFKTQSTFSPSFHIPKGPLCCSARGGGVHNNA